MSIFSNAINGMRSGLLGLPYQTVYAWRKWLIGVNEDHVHVVPAREWEDRAYAELPAELKQLLASSSQFNRWGTVSAQGLRSVLGDAEQVTVLGFKDSGKGYMAFIMYDALAEGGRTRTALFEVESLNENAVNVPDVLNQVHVIDRITSVPLEGLPLHILSDIAHTLEESGYISRDGDNDD